MLLYADAILSGKYFSMFGQFTKTATFISFFLQPLHPMYLQCLLLRGVSSCNKYLFLLHSSATVGCFCCLFVKIVCKVGKMKFCCSFGIVGVYFTDLMFQ